MSRTPLLFTNMYLYEPENAPLALLHVQTTAHCRCIFDEQTALVQQPNGEQTTTRYDLADEVTTNTLLSNGTTTTEDTYGYDAAGNQTTHTDADGRTTTTVYDPVGRVTQATASVWRNKNRRLGDTSAIHATARCIVTA